MKTLLSILASAMMFLTTSAFSHEASKCSRPIRGVLKEQAVQADPALSAAILRQIEASGCIKIVKEGPYAVEIGFDTRTFNYRHVQPSQPQPQVDSFLANFGRLFVEGLLITASPSFGQIFSGDEHRRIPDETQGAIVTTSVKHSAKVEISLYQGKSLIGYGFHDVEYFEKGDRASFYSQVLKPATEVALEKFLEIPNVKALYDQLAESSQP